MKSDEDKLYTKVVDLEFVKNFAYHNLSFDIIYPFKIDFEIVTIQN